MSIVSHGHGELVARLLRQLCGWHADQLGHVIVTHNLPASPLVPPPAGWPFEFTEVFNPAPAGFGTNHNRAFAHCHTEFFCVLNPDIELRDASIWVDLLRPFSHAKAGCAYPILLNPDGTRQLNQRELVTPLALLRRHLLKQPQRRTDWVSAAFWLVRSAAWRSVKGFDERYHMYCEDVDFCLRLQLAGWTLAPVDAVAVHPASWASRSLGLHLVWHLRSLLRLWASPALRAYLAKPALQG